MTADPRKERTREAVLTSARDQICQAGVNSLTIEGLAKESGVAKTTIYRHWESLDDIILEVFDALTGESKTYDTGSVEEDLQKYVVYFLGCFEKEDWAKCMPDIMEKAKHSPVFRAKKERMMSGNIVPMRDSIIKGIARKEIDPATNPEFLINQLIGPIFMSFMVNSTIMPKADAKELVTRTISSYRL